MRKIFRKILCRFGFHQFKERKDIIKMNPAWFFVTRPDERMVWQDTTYFRCVACGALKEEAVDKEGPSLNEACRIACESIAAKPWPERGVGPLPKSFVAGKAF